MRNTTAERTEYRMLLVVPTNMDKIYGLCRNKSVHRRECGNDLLPSSILSWVRIPNHIQLSAHPYMLSHVLCVIMCSSYSWVFDHSSGIIHSIRTALLQIIYTDFKIGMLGKFVARKEKTPVMYRNGQSGKFQLE